VVWTIELNVLLLFSWFCIFFF